MMIVSETSLWYVVKHYRFDGSVVNLKQMRLVSDVQHYVR